MHPWGLLVICGLTISLFTAHILEMKNESKTLSNQVLVEFILPPHPFSRNNSRVCRCGNDEFREAHRIERRCGASIMYECTVCGEYTL
jgi:hypothetical protein